MKCSIRNAALLPLSMVLFSLFGCGDDATTDVGQSSSQVRAELQKIAAAVTNFSVAQPMESGVPTEQTPMASLQKRAAQDQDEFGCTEIASNAIACLFSDDTIQMWDTIWYYDSVGNPASVENTDPCVSTTTKMNSRLIEPTRIIQAQMTMSTDSIDCEALLAFSGSASTEEPTEEPSLPAFTEYPMVLTLITKGFIDYTTKDLRLSIDSMHTRYSKTRAQLYYNLSFMNGKYRVIINASWTYAQIMAIDEIMAAQEAYSGAIKTQSGEVVGRMGISYDGSVKIYDNEGVLIRSSS